MKTPILRFLFTLLLTCCSIAACHTQEFIQNTDNAIGHALQTGIAADEKLSAEEGAVPKDIKRSPAAKNAYRAASI